MIRINNLTKIYKSKKRNRCKALDNINLTLPNNGLVFVLGKSGSGKSTLLNLIGGLDNITKGSIIVDGNNISYFNEKEFCDYRNTHIGFIFQDYHLIDELTVYDNICLSLNLRRIEDRNLVRNALKKVDLANYEDRYPSELSGGERQRVAIARAIVKKPRIILADEPTGNLDTYTSTSIIKLLKELSKECLILIVSHNVNDAYKYADRIIELSKGKIIKDNSKNPMYSDNVICYNNNIYYPGDKVLNDNDISLINSNMNNNSKIIKLDNKYISTSNQYITNDKVDIEKKRLSIFKEFSLSLKFLKNKIFNIIFSSFMVSAIMVILALAQTIITFDSGEIITKELNKLNFHSVYMEKESDFKEENGYQHLYPINSGDINYFYERGYNGDVYEVFNFSVPVTSLMSSSGRIMNRFDNSIFINETFGTLVVDESFLSDKIGEFELVCVVEEIKPCGVYITDYIADAILLKNNNYIYKDYSEILGNYTYSSFKGVITYINGIIKTNYKEKYKDIINQLLENKNIGIKDLYDDSLAQYFLNDLYDYLGYSYSFNMNFKEDFKDNDFVEFAWTNQTYFNDIPYVPVNGRYIFKAPSNYRLKDNEIVMDITKYNQIFGTEYTNSNVSTFKPHSVRITTYLFLDTEKRNVLIDEEVYIKTLGNLSWLFYATDDLFNKFMMNSFQTYGLYCDGGNLDVPIKQQENSDFKVRSYFIEGIHTMTKAVDVFIPIFRLIAIVLCVGIIFILVNFSTRMIKDKMHDIGILKALGTQNKSIRGVFGIQIFMIAIMTILMSAFGYYYFIDLANDVLIASLKELATSHIVLDLDFLTFKLSVVNINVILILFLSILSLFIPMIKIKNIKPVKIIKTKE